MVDIPHLIMVMTHSGDLQKENRVALVPSVISRIFPKNPIVSLLYV